MLVTHACGYLEGGFVPDLRVRLEQGKVLAVGTELSPGEGEAVLCRTGHAEEHLPCSRIVLATGYRPRTALAEALRGMAVPVHSIGDCHGGTRICDAVWQATATAETI